jgi:hypothetical protein
MRKDGRNHAMFVITVGRFEGKKAHKINSALDCAVPIYTNVFAPKVLMMIPATNGNNALD